MIEVRVMSNNCPHCDKPVLGTKRFCNSSCAAKYNNARRKLSNETKQKISNSLTKKFDIESFCEDYRNGIIIEELCEKYNVGRTTALKCLHLNDLRRETFDENSFCEKHKVNYVLKKDGSYHCKYCHTDKKQTRREQLKIKSVEYLGGECKHCTYKKSLAALEFHHLDPTEKEFNLSKMGSKCWEAIKTELDKCILLCANCHREEHERLRNIN